MVVVTPYKLANMFSTIRFGYTVLAIEKLIHAA